MNSSLAVVNSYDDGGAHVQLPNGIFVPVYAAVDGNGNTVSDAGYPVTKISAGGPAPGQTIKEYTGTVALPAGANTTVQPLETVTAGKTWYITDISITANTAQIFEITITSAGVPIFRAFVKGDTGPLELPGLETQPSASSGNAVNLNFISLAGFTVTQADFFIGGFEQ